MGQFSFLWAISYPPFIAYNIRVLLRRRREVFGDTGRYAIQNIALVDFGQGLHGIILFLRFEGCLEQLFDGFPAVLNDGLTLGFECIAFAGERDLRFCVGVLLAGRTQKAHPDKIEDFLFRLRESGNILLFKLDGRENGSAYSGLRRRR